jgi:hypothetical protein
MQNKNSEIKHGPWDHEEILQLKHLIKLHGNKWNLISQSMLTNRSPQQCCAKAASLRETDAHVKWTDEEISKIKELTAKYNANNWTAISKEMGTRTRAQCSSYWHNNLKREWKLGKWQDEETRALMDFVEMNGDRKWTDIALQLNRRPQDCRQKWKLIVNSKKNGVVDGDGDGVVDIDKVIHHSKLASPSSSVLHQKMKKGKDACILDDENSINDGDINLNTPPGEEESSYWEENEINTLLSLIGEYGTPLENMDWISSKMPINSITLQRKSPKECFEKICFLKANSLFGAEQKLFQIGL